MYGLRGVTFSYIVTSFRPVPVRLTSVPIETLFVAGRCTGNYREFCFELFFAFWSTLKCELGRLQDPSCGLHLRTATHGRTTAAPRQAQGPRKAPKAPVVGS